MNINTQNIKSFFYKYWWLFYILFFLFLGLLIYVISLNYNGSDTYSRINSINKRFDDCCEARNNIVNDSIRVINNEGEFGCLSFTLVWNSTDDLDLHVFDAKGNHIFFKKYCKSADNRFSSAGGQLDIDLNARGVDTDQPVENVYFKCTPPRGEYIVKIHAFEKRTPNPVNIKLIIRKNGRIIKEIPNVIKTNNEVVEIIKYQYNENQ